MASRLRTDRVTDAITPLVTRVATDEELRAQAKSAIDSARTIYSRVQSQGARKAAGSREVADEVVRAAGQLRDAAERLTARPPRKRRGRLGKLMFGAALAAAAVFGLRKALSKDDDEFDYQP
ncbi:MAG TPA: hypothetical protein VMU66_07790 [Gaiellales bacterium]|nr:hypothetical protein [Gaiellales bacterium]